MAIAWIGRGGLGSSPALATSAPWEGLSSLSATGLAGWLAGQGLSQDQRLFRLKLGAEGAGLDGALHGRALDATEALNADIPVRIQLICLSTRADLAPALLVGQPLSVELVTDRGELRCINGLITRAVQGPSDGGLQLWLLEAFDALSVMDQGANERVVIHGSVLDLLQAYIALWQADNPGLAQCLDFDLGGLHPQDYPVREFCMQTGESDTRYLLRRARKEGINWVVVPGRTARTSGRSPNPRGVGHTVRFFSRSADLPRNPAGTVAYKLDAAAQERDAITDWSEEHRLVPGRLVRQSSDYKAYGVQSTALPTRAAWGDAGQALASGLVDQQWDGAHWGDCQADHERLSTLRVMHHECRAHTVRGAGGVRDFAAGTWVEVTERPDTALLAPADRQFLLTRVRHFAQNNYGKELDARIEGLFARSGWVLDRPVIGVHGEARRYGNTFEAIPRAVPLVPEFDARRHWPRVHQRTAYVVGPPGEEVHLDELARPWISFPGVLVLDLGRGQQQGGPLAAGQLPDLHPTLRTSAPVRMVSPQASSAHGVLAPPRIGDEVLVDFLGGAPDRPVILGSVYSPHNPPSTFGHQGQLPGNRFLSGWKLKEVGSQRASDLRLDATPGQTGARLYSDHAHTRLSAGFIAEERADGQAGPLGEGLYACTDAAAATRAARGILHSAWARPLAGGQQLDCSELVGLLELSLNLLKSMGDYAEGHQAMPLDATTLSALRSLVQAWQAGSNVDPQSQAQDTGLIAHTAPQGLTSATPKGMAQYAGESIDTVAQRHLQQVAGQQYSVHAGQGICHFAHGGGIRQIAHQGDHLTQSQHGSIVLESARELVSRTVGDATHLARTHTFIAEDGSFIKIGAGGVTLGSNGPIQSFGSGFPHAGPQTLSGTPPQFGKGQPDGQFILRFGDPFHPESLIAPGMDYEISLSDGSTVKGVSDAKGQTSLSQRDTMHIASVRILKG